MIVSLWRYRRYILINAANDLRHRYAGSAMGVFWNILSPLAQILVFTLVFSQLMKIRLPELSSEAGFALYLCAGMLPWMAFAECVSNGAHAFLSNATYLKKLPIPEQVFVAQAAVSGTLSLAISMSLLFVINLVAGPGLRHTWLVVPVVLLLFQAFGFGLGLILSNLTVFFRDIGQVLPIGLQIWMWLTPIVYLKDIIPPHLQGALAWNPVYPYVDALHATIIYGVWPAPLQWAVMIALPAAAALAGYLMLRRLRPEIRDVL